MATIQNLTTTHAGSYAGRYILSAFRSLDDLNHLTVRENVPFKETVKRLVDTVSFQPRKCDWDPTGTVTITERTLTLEWFEVARQICKTEFLTDWEYSQMGAGKDQLAPDLLDALISNMSAAIAQEMGRIIWTGVNGTTGEFDGFKTLMLADSTVVDSLSQTSLTSSNIVTEIQDMLDTFGASAKGPAILSAQEKPKIYMNPYTFLLYQNAQMTLGNGTFFHIGGTVPPRYGQFDIAVCPGMPNNTMIFAQPSNLWFGTNVTSDMNNIRVVDTSETLNDDNVRFKAHFCGAVQYGFGDEICLYGT